MTTPVTCPHCETSLQGDPIPQEYVDAGYYPPEVTHYDRTIGVEVRGVYDGVLYWACPDCGHGWPRWTDGAGRLTALSVTHADAHNLRAVAS